MRILRCCLAVMAFATICFAQADRKDSKDYPLVPRMPNSFITAYTEMQFDQVVYKLGKNPAALKDTPVEGHVYKISYHHIDKQASKPSPLQVVRNIQNALTAIGGEILIENSWNGNSWRGTVVKVSKDNKVVWVGVKAAPSDYYLEIVEQQGMKQDIVADAKIFADDLSKSGKTTLNGIYFDTAKSTLKPESDATIAEIAKLLKEQPKLKVFIVGHTDSVGTVDSNLKLSQERARAVVTALTTRHGIAAARLVAFGNGPYAPVATNRDEDGRAKNRRVEMVEAGE